VGLLDSEVLIARWRLVLGLGAACVGLQWLVVGEWPYLLALGVVVAIMVVVAGSEAYPEPDGLRQLPRGSRRTIVGAFLLLIAAFQGLPMVAAIDLNRRLAAGEATIVEGTATIKGYGKTECLMVDDQRFCYLESAIQPGYNRRRYLFGQPEDGRQVRVSLIDGVIVRLEVATTP
jgi:hypothetical protein